MIKVEAIVREEVLEDVKEQLLKAGIRGITVSQVMGCGTQMGLTHMVRGNRVSTNLVPKIKFEIVVSNEYFEQQVIDIVTAAAHSGNPGDGKIFSYPISRAIRIRTGEEGVDALTPTTETI